MRNFNRLPVGSSEGFAAGVGPASARRQLNVSFGLTIVVMLATMATALTSGIKVPSRSQEMARSVVHSPSFVPVYHASQAALRNTGG